MNRIVTSIVVAVGLLASAARAEPVDYVKICSLYGAGFFFLPGTDICVNPQTGDARVQTEGGTWRSLLPYPTGDWTTDVKHECGPGHPVKLGTFASTDFELNAWSRMQAPAVPLKLNSDELVSKVIMSGGFHDPRVPARSGAPGTLGFCVRSIDPSVMIMQGDELVNPPWGNGLLPIGCVANSRIVNMPAAYAVAATSAYPSIIAGFNSADQTEIVGPVLYGSHLVVTTDMNLTLLEYFDATLDAQLPLAGSLTVWVCVEKAGKK